MFCVIICLNNCSFGLGVCFMKIGEFSKKFNVSVSTVRHYINLGLLVPEKDGYQYRFTDSDCREMEIIASMKDAGFKLNELNKYLSIFRFYNKDDYFLYEKLVEYLNEKKNRLYEERNQINTYIRLINKKIKEIESDHTYSSNKSAYTDTPEAAGPLPGFPLSAVCLLHCPHCQSKLNLSNVDISGDSIISGNLTCSCGYGASIKNGVMFTENLMDLENDPKFLECYFGEENLISNEDGMLLMGMKEHSNEYLTNLYKSSLWIYNELASYDFQGKTILCPDLSCQYLYSRYDGENALGSTFLVTALSERSIRSMRQHIANANPNLKVAYIINQNGRLPLKNSCIDVIIDYMGSCNLGFFQKTHYLDTVAPYIAEDALVVGTAEYYSPNSPSIKRIHQLYSNAAPDVFTFDFIKTTLEENGFNIEKTEKISEGYNPGRFFEYHIAGDIRSNIVYLARRPHP